MENTKLYLGSSLKELAPEDLEKIYGAGNENIEVAPRSTPTIIATISAITGIVSYHKGCLG